MEAIENLNAAEVCRKFSLGEMARKLLTPEQTAQQYLELLRQNKQYMDAVRLLAYSVPVKTGIIWANWCARYFLQANPSDKLRSASDAVDKWISEPNDENRRAAMQAAQAAEYGTPSGSAALAVFFSGGNIAPVVGQVVEPQPYLAPNAVVGSVLLAATLKEPEHSEARFQTFIAEGLKLAQADKQ